MTILYDLIDAIERRAPVAIRYNGKLRYICPYMLGETGQKGHVLHAFQFAGETRNGLIGNPEDGAWRFFYLDKVEGWLVLPKEQWGWYPENLAKAEGEYRPPPFVTKVLALNRR